MSDTTRTPVMPLGGLARRGARAPASPYMNESSSCVVRPAMGALATGESATATQGLLGSLLVKRKPSRSNWYVVCWSAPE